MSVRASEPRVLFFAEAGGESGGGAVMRCMTLARALVERGCECAFVESRAAAPVLRRFGWPAQTLIAMVGDETLEDQLAWALRFADLFEADVVVVDHGAAGAAEERRLRGAVRRIVVIDDRTARPHDADLLVDPGFGRRRDDYAGLAPAASAVLVGPDHALVRPEFAQARPRALSRRARHDPVRRALVSFGLSDAGRIAHRTVAALAPRLGEVRLDVVVPPDAPSRVPLAELAASDPRLHIRSSVEDMVMLMVEADVAVGAGGSSVWERACLGLPAAVAVIVGAHARSVERLGEAGAVLPLDARSQTYEDQLAAAWGRLTLDRQLRWDLASRSAELCDGRGASRVAEAVLDLPG